MWQLFVDSGARSDSPFGLWIDFASAIQRWIVLELFVEFGTLFYGALGFRVYQTRHFSLEKEIKQMPIGNHQVYDRANQEIIGNHNVINGNNCTVIGNHNVINGHGCSVTGNHNLVYGKDCRVTGNHNKTHASCQVEGNFNSRLNAADQSVNRAFAESFDRVISTAWDNIVVSNSVLSNVSIGSNTIGNESFNLQGRKLTVLNLQIDQLLIVGNRRTLRWAGNELIYDGNLHYNGKQVDVSQLFSADRSVMDWAEFRMRLERISERKLEGQDQQTEDESQACVICMDNRKCCAMIPCGHVCLCIECANEFRSKSCPICRMTVDKINRIFI